MQRLARELNLSETVFVFAPERGGDARIRIFTPAAELPFAGHPVLGTAIALGIERGREQVTLETGAGLVAVALRERWRARGIWDDGPADPVVAAIRARGRVARCAGRGALGTAGGGLRERPQARVRRARQRERGGGAGPRPACAGRAGRAGRQLLRGCGRPLEDAHVRAGARRAGGPGDGVGGGAAGGAPRAPRQDRVRRGDRDPPGRGGGARRRCCARERSARRMRSSAWRLAARR